MKLIYLEWADAHTNTSGWKTEAEAKFWAKETNWFIRECGWVIEETKEYIAIATGLKPENDYEEKQFLNLHKIPKTWIRRRKIISLRKE